MQFVRKRESGRERETELASQRKLFLNISLIKKASIMEIFVSSATAERPPTNAIGPLMAPTSCQFDEYKELEEQKRGKLRLDNFGNLI